MDKLIVSCILYGIVAVLITENSSMPILRVKRLLLFDCDTKITCGMLDEDFMKICGSDGHTYDSSCILQLTNQKNACERGNFNPITVVHTGSC